MTDNEVNKIIAEFMELDVHRIDGFAIHVTAPTWNENYTDELPLFTQSLDALVPVWDKMDSGCIPEVLLMPKYPRKGENKPVTLEWRASFKMEYGFGETIQQAAAHATAKAILELDS